MEEKNKEVKQYIQKVVDPIIRPLVQQIVKQRPTQLIKFICQHMSKLMDHQKNEQHHHSDQEEQSQETQLEFLKKLQEKKKSQKTQKKKSRQGISAQVFGNFNKKSSFQAKVLPKSSQTKEQIKKLIEKSILFQSLNQQDLHIVIDAMEQITAQPGQAIITEGQQGNVLYIIESGQYDCSKILKGKQTYLKTYKSGQFFGQLALMYNALRQASIKCKSQGKLYGLDRATFNHIVQEAATKKRKYLSEVLSKVQIFSEIDPYEKEQLCDALKQEEYPAGSEIVKQGDQGDRFYIIAQGKLIAEKRENPQSQVRKVFEYKDGDYFGEIALVKNTVRQATIKAQTPCRLVSIERQSFKRLLGPMSQILERNMDKYKKYMLP